MAKILFFSLMLMLQTAVAYAQPKTPPSKTTRRIYDANGLTLDAEITVSPKPAGSSVKIKYIYDGTIPIQEAHVNWKISYLNESDQLVIKCVTAPIGGSELQGTFGTKAESQTSALDQPFLCRQLVNICYDIAVGARPIAREDVSAEGLPADSVAGAAGPEAGQGRTLRVVGGSLPQGGNWVWYEGQCGGTRAGTGRSLAVSPRGSTTYFVKAEPGTGPCLTATVRVGNRSVAPAGISGPTTLCKGEPLVLAVVGGALGIDADWVWYSGDCGGTRLSRGRTFTTTAQTRSGGTSTTTYFVRAEGKFNTTECVQQTVAVTPSSEAPTGISYSGPTQFCEGSAAPVVLKVSGGRLAPGAHWAWYADVCSGPPLSLGETYSPTPRTTTQYLVRAEGPCMPSATASLRIRVNGKSYAAQDISGPGFVTRKQSFLLQVQGGQLGENSQWKWYANDCGKGSLLGTGPSLTLKLRKPTTVFVKAVGPCGETGCVSKSVSTGAAPGWEHAFQAQKFMHVGIGFGFDFQHASILTSRQTYIRSSRTVRTDSVRSDANAYGVLGEFTFHPIIKNGFSVGLRSSAAIGSGIYGLRDSSSLDGKKRFSYFEFKAGGEVAIGARRLKLLLVQEHRYREYRFENRSSEWRIDQREKSYFTKLGAGVRIGAYGRSKKVANTVDFLGFVAHSTPTLSPKDLYAGTANWNVGAGFNWWCHNKIGLRMEATLLEVRRQYSPLNTSFNGAQFNVSLVLKEDFFR